jgi:hypothetical protein
MGYLLPHIDSHFSFGDYMSESIVRIDAAVDIGSSVEETPEGYLKVTAPIARTGIYTYRKADGSVQRELVTPEVLFNPDSISTLKLKPMTNRHPQELLLDTKSVKKRNVGSVGETIKKDGDKLVASFIITDQDAINAAKRGRLQLSPGYQTVHDKTPGVWNGQEYDVVQTTREYNHLALVDKARGGAELKINMDSEDEIGLSDNEEEQTNNDGEVMGEPVTKTIKIDGATVEVPEDVAAHVASVVAKLDSATDEVTDLKTKNNELQTKVDSFDAELKTKVDAAVDERVSLITDANSVFNADNEDDQKIISNLDGMSNGDIQKAIILKVQPSAKAKLDSDDLPDGYIASRYDAAMELSKENAKNDEEDDKQNKLDSSRQRIKPTRNVKNDEEDKSPEAAQSRMVRADEEAWKLGEEENK